MSKILFDANVLLDFFLSRNSHPEILERLFSLVDKRSVRGVVTLSSIHICAYYLSSAKGIKVTKEILEMIIARFHLVEGNKKAVLNAIKSDLKDIEDAIQYFIALENELDGIVTSDIGFIKLSSTTLPIYSPADLLRELGH